MNIKEFREATKAEIAWEQHWLEKTEAILQKDYCQDPAKQKFIAPLHRMKRILQKNIKVYEKVLEQISKESL